MRLRTALTDAHIGRTRSHRSLHIAQAPNLWAHQSTCSPSVERPTLAAQNLPKCKLTALAVASDEMLLANCVLHEAFPRCVCMRSYRNAAPACGDLGTGSRSYRRTWAVHRPLTTRKDHLSTVFRCDEPPVTKPSRYRSTEQREPTNRICLQRT